GGAPWGRSTGVEHDDVERPDRGLGLGDQPVDPVVGEVDGEPDRPRETGRQLPGPVTPPSAQHHSGTLVREGGRHGESEPGGGAQDQCAPPGQPEIHQQPPSSSRPAAKTYSTTSTGSTQASL